MASRPDEGLRVAAVNLRVIRDRAVAAGGAGAAAAMARQGQQTDREVLTLTQHPANTRTPAPEDAPPSSITGELAADMGAGEAVPAGAMRWEAHAGPRGILARSKWGPTGRFLEFGGTQYAHQPHGMSWYEDGQWHPARVRRPLMEITKEPRPYLEYAMEVMRADGSLHDAAVRGFSDAMGF